MVLRNFKVQAHRWSANQHTRRVTTPKSYNISICDTISGKVSRGPKKYLQRKSVNNPRAGGPFLSPPTGSMVAQDWS